MKIQNQCSLKFGPFWIGNKYNILKISYVLSYYFLLQSYFFIFFFQHFFIESILNCFSSFLFLFTYFNCVLREPGVIKKVLLSDVENNNLQKNQRKQTQILNEYFKERFCRICNTMCPPKTHHCDKCNNCVKHFDNHIDQMGNCIGIRNYKYFIGWIYTLVFQYIIWYVVMIQHFLQKLEFLEWFFERIEELYNYLYYTWFQIIIQSEILLIIIIIWLCYFMIFYKPGILGKLFKMLIIILLLQIFLIPVADSYYDSIYCSFFLQFSLKQFIVHSFNIAIGVNQFEWSVLEKQYDSVDSDTILIVKLNNDNSSNNNDNQILEQSLVTNNEDRILKEIVIKELNCNINLKDLIDDEEFINNALIQKKKIMFNKDLNNKSKAILQIMKTTRHFIIIQKIQENLSSQKFLKVSQIDFIIKQSYSNFHSNFLCILIIFENLYFLELQWYLGQLYFF